ncbi:MAG: CPBP family intramembrane metalloprotease [Acholeplasmatales bacterium]|nr:MAG: CPBP family intramembrane metalloprotease [Acholeplasmatales bacterium]
MVMKSLLKSFLVQHPMVEAVGLKRFNHPLAKGAHLFWMSLVLISLVFVGSIMVLIPASFVLQGLFQVDAVTAYLDGLPAVWQDFVTFSANLSLMFLGVHLALFLWLKLVEKRSYGSLGIRVADKLPRVLIGFGLGVLSMTLVTVLMVAVSDARFFTGERILSGWAALPMIILLLVPWSIQASAEEVVFQGWFVPTMAKQHGTLLAIIFAAGLFALLHSFNPGIHALGVVNLMLYAIFAALYMLYERSVLGIAAFHISWNWSQGHVFGLLVSGTHNVSASLFGVEINTNNVLTGGDFGPEGSVIVTVVFTLGIALILFLQHRRTKRMKAEGVDA